MTFLFVPSSRYPNSRYCWRSFEKCLIRPCCDCLIVFSHTLGYGLVLHGGARTVKGFCTCCATFCQWSQLAQISPLGPKAEVHQISDVAPGSHHVACPLWVASKRTSCWQNPPMGGDVCCQTYMSYKERGAKESDMAFLGFHVPNCGLALINRQTMVLAIIHHVSPAHTWAIFVDGPEHPHQEF